jgi:hypothetical protein
MIIAIDPDVFIQSSGGNKNCTFFLSELQSQISEGNHNNYQIALGPENGLYVPYLNLFKSFREQPYDSSKTATATDLVIAILSSLVVDDGKMPVYKTYEKEDLPDISTLIKECNLSELEAILANMARIFSHEESSCQNDFLIVLSGQVATRRLHIRAIQQVFWKNGINIDVRLADETQISLPIDSRFDESWKTKFHSRIFELLVQNEIILRYKVHNQKYNPQDIGLGKEEEIDFYGISPDNKTIWVGECKLRSRNNASTPLGEYPRDKKFVGKVKRIRSYFPEKVIIPFYASNGEEINKDFSSTLSGEKINYFKVAIDPKNWWETDRWYLSSFQCTLGSL